jgi:anaerobic selenocysteine-containing dehydrogenase
MCGLRIEVAQGRVERIRPDPEDVWSRGYMCPKGATIGDLHHDPDRLRTPLVKRDGRFVEATWNEAFAECERLLHGVLEQHGREAITAFIGNPTASNFSLSRYVGAFMAFSQLDPIYSSGTVDQWPKNLSCALMYGGMWTIPTADIDHSDYLVVMGANPHASQGSLMCAPDFLGRMDAICERGGKTLVIDPRRTGTADRASEWLAIRPGTDAAMLLGVLHVVFAEGLEDHAHLDAYLHGVESVRELTAEWAPERVAATCGIAADDIRRIAREFCAAPSAAWYARIGTCNQEFGTLASWLVDVLNIVTGNFDRRGGMMFSKPIAWPMVTLPDPQWQDGFALARHRSRVRGAPEILGQYPASCLAEEIATPGEGQLKALITIAGNPVISLPQSEALDAALPELDCMISLDLYVNETTRHADVILPALSALEQPHYDELFWSWSVRNAGRYSDVVFEPPAEARAEWQSLIMLGLLCAGQKAADIDVQQVDQLYFAGIAGVVCGLPDSPVAGRDPAELVAATNGAGPERIVDFQIRTGPYGDAYGSNPDGLTLAKLREHADGIDVGPLEPRLPEVLTTESGKIELAPEYIVNDLARLAARLGREDGTVLVSRRHVRSKNSWMHNVPALVSGKDRCTLLVHPDDAEKYGLEDGGLARVTSSGGSLRVPVEVSEEMMPGVVCLPHGWGHDKPGARLAVASRHAGVCNNAIAPGDFVDAISGNAAVNGIPVELAPA